MRDLRFPFLPVLVVGGIMRRRGQGSLEYLLILGAAVSLASIVILLLTTLGSSCNATTTLSTANTICRANQNQTGCEGQTVNGIAWESNCPGTNSDTACCFQSGNLAGLNCTINPSARADCSAAPPACSNDCSPSGNICMGNNAVVCGEANDGDTCLEILSTNVCSFGCTAGTCDPAPSANACSFSTDGAAILIGQSKTVNVTISSGTSQSFDALSSCGTGSANNPNGACTGAGCSFNCGPYSTRGPKTVSAALLFSGGLPNPANCAAGSGASFCVEPCTNGQSQCTTPGGLGKNSCLMDTDSCRNWLPANCAANQACVGAGTCVPQTQNNKACRIVGAQVVELGVPDTWLFEFTPGLAPADVIPQYMTCDSTWTTSPTLNPVVDCDFSTNYNCNASCPAPTSALGGPQSRYGYADYPPADYVECTQDYCVNTGCTVGTEQCNGNTIQTCTSWVTNNACHFFTDTQACTGGDTCQIIAPGDAQCQPPAAATCTVSVDPVSLAAGAGASTQVTITPQNFQNNDPPLLLSFNCGAGSGASPTGSCSWGAMTPNTPCVRTCAPYTAANNVAYSVLTTLRKSQSGTNVVCTPADVNAKACSLSLPSPFVEWSATASGTTNVSFPFTGFWNLPNPQSFSCGGGTAAPALPVCSSGPSACQSVACSAYSSLGNKTVSFSAKDGTAITEPLVSCNVPLYVIPEGGGQLVGHWTFDAKSGSQYLNDYEPQTGPRLNITGSGAPLREMPFNAQKSVYFEGFSGANQYLAGSSAININNSDYSVSMWVNVGQGNGARPLLSLCNGTGIGQCHFVRYQHWGGVTYAIEGQTDYQSPSGPGEIPPVNNVITPGKWQHVVWTYNVGTLTWRLYIDGALRQTYANIRPLNVGTAAPNLCIGAWCNNGTGGPQNYFNGKIKDVWIFKGTLTQNGVNQLRAYLAPPVPNYGLDPVASWSFEESGTPTTYADSSGNAFTLAKRSDTVQVPGRIGKGISLESVAEGRALETDFIDLSNSPFTIVMWVNPSTTVHRGGDFFSLCETYNVNSKCLHAFTYTDSGVLRFGINGDNDYQWIGHPSGQEPFVLNNGRWNMIALVRQTSPAGYSVYVNPNPSMANLDFWSLPALQNTFGVFCLGKFCFGPDPYSHFPGLIDEVKVYKRALSVAELRGLYTAGGGDYANGDGTGNACWPLATEWTVRGAQMIHRGNSTPLANAIASNPIPGTLNGGATLVPGCTGNAFNFPSAGSFVNLTDNSDFLMFNDANPNKTNFAIRAWIKTSDATNQGTVFERFGGPGSASNYNRVWLGTNYPGQLGKATFLISNGTSTCVVTGVPNVADGQWHHIIAVRSPSDTSNKLKIFVDGQRTVVSNPLCGSNFGNATATATLGGGRTSYADAAPNTNWFNGQIDEVAVWTHNFAYLSDTEAYLLR